MRKAFTVLGALALVTACTAHKDPAPPVEVGETTSPIESQQAVQAEPDTARQSKSYAILLSGGDGSFTEYGIIALEHALSFFDSNDYDTQVLFGDSKHEARKTVEGLMKHPENLYDLTKANLQEALTRVQNQVGEGDNVFISIMLHGQPSDGGEVSHTVSGVGESFSLDELIESLGVMITGKGANVVVLDSSCYSGASLNLFARTGACVASASRSNERGIATFASSFYKSLESGKSMEEIFLSFRKDFHHFAVFGDPQISTPEGIKTYKLLSPAMNIKTMARIYSFEEWGWDPNCQKSTDECLEPVLSTALAPLKDKLSDQDLAKFRLEMTAYIKLVLKHSKWEHIVYDTDYLETTRLNTSVYGKIAWDVVLSVRNHLEPGEIDRLIAKNPRFAKYVEQKKKFDGLSESEKDKLYEDWSHFETWKEMRASDLIAEEREIYNKLYRNLNLEKDLYNVSRCNQFKF